MENITKFIPQKLRAPLAQNALVKAYRRQKYTKILRQLSEPVPWNISEVKVDAKVFEIQGWAIAPQGDHTRAIFTLNGEVFDEIEYPLPRADIETIFWYYPGTNLSGFTCRSQIQAKNHSAAGFATLQYVERDTQLPFCQEHNHYYPEPRVIESLPIPNATRRYRVHGGDSESSFLIEGFTTYKKLQQVLKTHFERDYEDFANILDWGCGCGRLTRYFQDLKHTAVTGVDIDADNIQWNQQHLGFGNYATIPLHPPTSLPESAYQLLIGISIFTHLCEEDQLEWLAELARIAADGAILLMTIHSDTTVCRSNLPFNLYSNLQTNGFLDVGSNPNLAGVLDVEDYYRNTYHTHAYIRENWSRYFEVIAILPGLIGNHQDLVLLRK